MLDVYYQVEQKLLGEWIPFTNVDWRPIKHPSEISAIGEMMYAEKEWPNGCQFRVVRKTREPLVTS